MKKIAIFNRKGGVGKTATCVNLGGCLDVIYNQRVLLIDCDAQMNTTTYLYPDEKMSNGRKTVIDLFGNEPVSAEELIRKVEIERVDKKKQISETRISLIAGSAELDFDFMESDKMFALKNFLETVEDDFDYALFDCPPSLTDATIVALCSCDYVIVPVESGAASANGYGMVIEELDQMKQNGFNVNIKILGAFLSKVDKRYAIDNYYKGLWKKEFGSKVFLSSIRLSSDVKNANEFNKPVHYYKKNSPVGKDYEELAYELINKVKADVSKRKRGK